MNKQRLFLPILVMVMLLLNALMSQLQTASPMLDTPAILGIPFWQLQIPLTSGLFTAISMAAAIGIGAFFWLGLLPACGATWTPEKSLLQMGRCSLHCSWPLAACLSNALCYFIFPWMQQDYLDARLSGTSVLIIQLCLGMLLMLCTFVMFAKPRHEDYRLLGVFLSALTALSCGLLWWGGKAQEFLILSLASSVAVSILLPHRPETRKQLGALLAVTLALCVYVIGFGRMMTAYAPTHAFTPDSIGNWNLLNILSVTAAAVAVLGIAVYPMLRRGAKPLVGIPITLCGLVVIYSIVRPDSNTAGVMGTDTTTAADAAKVWISYASRQCAGAAAALTMVVSLIPVIRRNGLALRICAGLTLILALTYAWLLMCEHLSTLALEEPITSLHHVCYALSLILIALLASIFYALKTTRSQIRDNCPGNQQSNHKQFNE